MSAFANFSEGLIILDYGLKEPKQNILLYKQTCILVVSCGKIGYLIIWNLFSHVSSKFSSKLDFFQFGHIFRYTIFLTCALLNSQLGKKLNLKTDGKEWYMYIKPFCRFWNFHSNRNMRQNSGCASISRFDHCYPFIQIPQDASHKFTESQMLFF